MLGYNIGVYRQADGGHSPTQPNAAHGSGLAIWQTIASRGLDWIKTLVVQGRATSHGGNGYPLGYTAMAKEVIPFIADNPPFAKNPWVIPEGSVLMNNYLGETTIDKEAIAACRPDERLIGETWDES